MEKRTEIILWDAMYEIDPLKQAFIQSTNPQNQIPFSSFREEGGFLILEINPFNHKPSNAAAENPEKNVHERLVLQQELLLPHFIAEGDFVRLHNDISYKHGWNTVIVDHIIRDRLEGKLPLFEINGEKWTVDVANNEMRLTNTGRVIPEIDHLLLNEMGLFDPNQRKLIGFYDELDAYRNDLIVVQFPKLQDLDPIGIAVKNGLESTAYLTKTPQKDSHTADLMPYSETFRLLTAHEIKRRLNSQEHKQETSKPVRTKTKQKRNGIR